MEWLSQNWIWLALAVGVVVLFSRGRHGAMTGGCCGQHTAHDGPAGAGKSRGDDGSQTPAKVAEATATGTPVTSSHRQGQGGCH